MYLTKFSNATIYFFRSEILTTDGDMFSEKMSLSVASIMEQIKYIRNFNPCTIKVYNILCGLNYQCNLFKKLTQLKA